MEDEDNQQRFQYYLKLPAFILFVSTACLASILLLTSPSEGPVAIVSFLVCGFLFFAALAAFFVQKLLQVFGRQNITPVKLFYASTILSMGATFIVGLQTLNQLQFIDVILVLFLEVIVLFYLAKRF